MGPATVPLLDLKPQYRALQAELDAALLGVAASQMFILGPAVRELEAEVAAYCGAQHGIGMSSGTDALLAALMALDVGPGDEVITSSYTFFASGGTIARLGARPVFLDIEPDTFNLDVGRVREFLAGCRRGRSGLRNPATGGRIRAVMPVHLYGQAAGLDELLALVREHDLLLVEDAAQAIGAEDAPGRRIGARGEVGCLSFFPTKNLGAFGDGGMCLTNDAALAARLRQMRVHGMEPRYHHAFVGGNFRLDEIQAAVLLVKLRHLDDWHAARQRNAALYDRGFAAAGITDRVRTPLVRAGARHVFHQYVIRVPRRDELRAFLGARGIGTEIYYPVPLHLQQCFAGLGGRPGDCPEAERAAGETLALPIYPELTEVQLQHVVDSIATFLKQ